MAGNHDCSEDLARYSSIPLKLQNGEYFDQREVKGVPFFFLDTSLGSVSKQQLVWLKEEAKQKTSERTSAVRSVSNALKLNLFSVLFISHLSISFCRRNVSRFIRTPHFPRTRNARHLSRLIHYTIFIGKMQ